MNKKMISLPVTDYEISIIDATRKCGFAVIEGAIWKNGALEEMEIYPEDAKLIMALRKFGKIDEITVHERRPTMAKVTYMLGDLRVTEKIKLD